MRADLRRQTSLRQLGLMLLLPLLLACSESNKSAPEQESSNSDLSESERLNQWLETKYSEQLEFSPIALTYQGSKKLYDQIDDFSPEAIAEQLNWQKLSLEQMQASFDYAALDNEAKTSYDLWQYGVDMAVEAAAFQQHDYLFEQMDGYHTSLPTFLMSFHPVESEQDLAAYIERIAGIGVAINQLRARALDASLLGIRPPAFSYEFVLTESRALISGKPFQESDTDSPVWADIKGKIAALQASSVLSAEQAQTYEHSARAHLLNVFEPAYSALIAFVEADLGNSSEQPQGVWALPDGEQFYRHMLKDNTTTELSAEAIHQLGLSEVARLRTEMIAVKEATGFDGDLMAFFSYIRDSLDDDRFYYPDTDAGRQAYIDDASQAIDNIRSQLPNYFGLMPKADLVVKRVEAFREQPGAAQHYYPSTPDGSRPGIYYAHLSDMKTMPKNQLEVIAYHEGLPGHHMQIAIAQEQESLPRFRRQGFHTAYGEGWALYAELLAKEIPQTYQDHYSDFGRLSTEIWRAIRLVVDTGLHAMGWTEQQAIDYFLANSPEPLEGIRSEVRRYLVLPGQATSYKIGMLDILRLREKSETALAEKFDIRAFHDQILGGGSLPLMLLEQRIDRWIQSQS